MTETALAEVPEQQDSNLLVAIQQAASNKDVDTAKFQALLDMRFQLEAHYAEKSFNRDFAKMQAELPVITKKGEIKVGTQVRSTYARFEDINEAVKPILQKYGFAVSFRQSVDDNTIHTTCILMHQEGHREQTAFSLPADASGSKNAVQAIGSSAQYGKRYALTSMLNISTGEDDDGMAAAGAPKISDDDLKDLEAMIEEVGANRNGFIKYCEQAFGASSLADIRADDYAKAVAALEAKRKQRK